VEERENDLGHLQAERGEEEAGEEAEAGELRPGRGESAPSTWAAAAPTGKRRRRHRRANYRERRREPATYLPREKGGRGGGGGSSTGRKAFAKARGSDAIYWQGISPFLPWKGSVFWSSTHVVDFTSHDRFCCLKKTQCTRTI
jgi:hypothetical protein